MNNITLAQLVEQKFKSELLPEHDARKYLKTEWFINELIALFDKHPDLTKNININNMTINMIINLIESYFVELNKVRGIDDEKMVVFVEKGSKFRCLESLALLLIIGFSFLNAFRRISNKYKKAGECKYLESEGGVTINIDTQETIPQQVTLSEVKDLYALCCNDTAPGQLINNLRKNVESSIEVEPTTPTNNEMTKGDNKKTGRRNKL